MVWTGLKLTLTLLAERPDVAISTGRAPGFFAIRVGVARSADDLDRQHRKCGTAFHVGGEDWPARDAADAMATSRAE